MAFPLAERPVAAADHPYVALGGVWNTPPGPSLLGQDPAPVRSLWQFGAHICHSSAERNDGGVVVAPPPSAAGSIVLSPHGNGRFAAEGGAVSPLLIAGLREWFGPGGRRIGSTLVGPSVAAAPEFTALVDLQADCAFLVDGAHAGGLSAFVVRLSSSGRPVLASALSVMSPTPDAPLDRPLRGTRLGFSELADRLPWTSLPMDAAQASVVLLGGWQPLRLERVDGQLVMPLPRDMFLWVVRRWIHVDRFYYYLECQQPDGVWRSAVDWFVLDPELP
jgi:hypothetical protein